MFKRSIQIGLVKKETPPSKDEARELFAEKVTVVRKQLRKVAIDVGVVVAGYVLLDTFRQMMIETTKKTGR